MCNFLSPRSASLIDSVSRSAGSWRELLFIIHTEQTSGDIFAYYYPVTLFSVISKIFEKFVNNRLLDQLVKCGLVSDFKYGFISSRSTAEFMTVLFDRITVGFNKSRSTRAMTLDIPKAHDMV